MPEIIPAAGDLIQIFITGSGGAAPLLTFARIGTKDGAGKQIIELDGKPPLRGLVNMQDYEWDNAVGYWKQKPEESIRSPRRYMGPVTPDQFEDELEIKASMLGR